MKYYIVVGEASGDLHASHLMRSLSLQDREAKFRFMGGDMMSAVGGELVKHYKDMAFMGFIPVLMHLPTILSNMNLCKKDIFSWSPDVVILVDYPGFNLEIAKYVHLKTSIPVYYYISPKIWAWKEYRIKSIKRYVDEMFSILPFEVAYYEKKHNFPIHYVGNPTLDEIDSFLSNNNSSFDEFVSKNNLDKSKPIIALLAGSRKQEIKDNLLMMINASMAFAHSYQLVLAEAPAISEDFYNDILDGKNVVTVRNNTFDLLRHSHAALVTSGTATLETALFNVPQVVCYNVKFGKIVSLLKKLVLSVKFVSLVNLIAGYEVVHELIAGDMTVDNVRLELGKILSDDSRHRKRMLEGYSRMRLLLGEAGAPDRAAEQIVSLLKKLK